jgi:hypothetical protein
MAKNLTLLLNQWLQRKAIPPEHTTSRLILIAKKPIDKQNGNTLDEFRPLAVTSVLFKLLEVLVHKRLRVLLDSSTIRPLKVGYYGTNEVSQNENSSLLVCQG